MDTGNTILAYLVYKFHDEAKIQEIMEIFQEH